MDHISIDESPMTPCMCAFFCLGVLSLSRTGGALSFFVDTNLASEAFIVRFVGSRDRFVPVGPGRVCVCIAIKKVLLEALQRLYGARKPSCVRGILKTFRGTSKSLQGT